jgi:hypothetical protein
MRMIERLLQAQDGPAGIMALPSVSTASCAVRSGKAEV